MNWEISVLHFVYSRCLKSYWVGGLLSFSDPPNLCMRELLVTREKEYKLAALKAKQEGDLEKAKEYMRTGKVKLH